MPDLLKNADIQTRLAEAGNLEILLFTLGLDGRTGRDEIFGINVLKVREVLRVPVVTGTPQKISSASGTASFHGVPIPVIDLAKYVGMETDRAPETMIVTEYNGKVHGLLVRAAANILIVDGAAMRVPPPKLLAEIGGLVTAVTEMQDGRRVLMLDTERVLAKANHIDKHTSNIENVPQGNERKGLHSGDSTQVRIQNSPTWDLKRVEVSHGEVRPDSAQAGGPVQIEASASLVGTNKMEILLLLVGQQ